MGIELNVINIKEMLNGTEKVTYLKVLNEKENKAFHHRYEFLKNKIK